MPRPNSESQRVVFVMDARVRGLLDKVVEMLPRRSSISGLCDLAVRLFFEKHKWLKHENRNHVYAMPPAPEEAIISEDSLPTSQQSKPVNLFLEPDVLDALDRFLSRMPVRISRSAVIEMACVEFLKHHGWICASNKPPVIQPPIAEPDPVPVIEVAPDLKTEDAPNSGPTKKPEKKSKK